MRDAFKTENTAFQMNSNDFHRKLHSFKRVYMFGTAISVFLRNALASLFTNSVILIS